jgi:hypothetical protein
MWRGAHRGFLRATPADFVPDLPRVPWWAKLLGGLASGLYLTILLAVAVLLWRIVMRG